MVVVVVRMMKVVVVVMVVVVCGGGRCGVLNLAKNTVSPYRIDVKPILNYHRL